MLGVMRVLLVEDDVMIGRALRPPLEKAGMTVDWVQTGQEAVAALRRAEHAVALLDIGLPDMSGLEVLDVVRRAKVEVPILLVTARDALADRVDGLDAGADDYLVKPFEVPELLARIRAVTRRGAAGGKPCLEARAMQLDLAGQELTYNGVTRVLSPREFALMHALMERPGVILSKAQIEDRLYGWGPGAESNTVDVLIYAIRRKFDKNVIYNIRGAGWMVRKPVV